MSPRQAQANENVLGDENEPKQPLRILALHGSEGNGTDFQSRLEHALQECESIGGRFDIQITALTAPFPKGDGYAWWTMGPGQRSFNADTYKGFEESEALIRGAFEDKEGRGEKFDLVVGHSQGAILTAALLASQRFPYVPTKGFVLNGAAMPNPYRSKLHHLNLNDSEKLCRVLFLMGKQDRVNPLDSAEELGVCLNSAGAKVSTIEHPGGHSFPFTDICALESLSAWIQR